MIARIWHGWTTHQNAEEYENLLKTEIFGSIEKKNIPGFKKISLLKRKHIDEVEFITIMIFTDLDSIKLFVGEDYEKAYVPESARKVLKRFDARSQHYEIAEDRDY